MNNELLIDHETSTGAEKFINKEHFRTLELFKKDLKSSHTIWINHPNHNSEKYSRPYCNWEDRCN